MAQGHVLQIDSPHLGIERAGYFQDEPLPKSIEAMEMHVAALNKALACALCLPFANPRTSHEVDAFRTQKLSIA